MTHLLSTRKHSTPILKAAKNLLMNGKKMSRLFIRRFHNTKKMDITPRSRLRRLGMARFSAMVLGAEKPTSD